MVTEWQWFFLGALAGALVFLSGMTAERYFARLRRRRVIDRFFDRIGVETEERDRWPDA